MDCGARAPVRLDHVAVDPDGAFAQLVEPGHRAQRASDQALDLLGAAADPACRGFARGARRRRPREHAVLARHPAASLAAQERRHTILDARGADHARKTGLDEYGAFRVHDVVGRDAGLAQFVSTTAVEAGRVGQRARRSHEESLGAGAAEAQRSELCGASSWSGGDGPKRRACEAFRGASSLPRGLRVRARRERVPARPLRSGLPTRPAAGWAHRPPATRRHQVEEEGPRPRSGSG